MPGFHDDTVEQELLCRFLTIANNWSGQNGRERGFVVSLKHGKRSTWIRSNIDSWFQYGIFQGYRSILAYRLQSKLRIAERKAKVSALYARCLCPRN